MTAKYMYYATKRENSDSTCACIYKRILYVPKREALHWEMLRVIFNLFFAITFFTVET